MPGLLSPVDTAAAIESLHSYTQRELSRFGTGWSIDTTCGEIGTGEMALLRARTSAGKSTCVLNMVANTPEVPTLVVSMEMTPRRQIEWLTAMTYDLSVAARDIEDVLRAGSDDDRFPEVQQALKRLPELYPNLHFVTTSRPTVSDLQFVVEDIESATGVRPIRLFVDHLGLLGGAEDGYSGYLRATSGLHHLAMREELAVVVLQQVGRSDGQGGRQTGHKPLALEDGKYGGEEDADWVYGLYRPDKDPKFKKSRYQFEDQEDYWQMRSEYEKVRGIAVFQVLKNRPLDTTLDEGVELQYDPHTKRYRETGVHQRD